MNILEIGVGLVKKKIEQNLYYIYKIPSNKIRNLERYSFKEARENGDIVAIGDNLVVSAIQQYHKNNKTPEQLFNEVESIRKEIKRLKITIFKAKWQDNK